MCYKSPYLLTTHITVALNFRTADLKAKSICSFKNIAENEKNFISKIQKADKKSRRHSVALTFELEHFFSRDINKKKNENKKKDSLAELNKELSDSYDILNIEEPKLFIPEILKDIKDETSAIDNMDSQSINSSVENFNKSRNYGQAKSKLKSYIRSNRNFKTPSSLAQRKYSKSAIMAHSTGFSNNVQIENLDSHKELKLCSHLLKTIEKDIKKNKGKY